MLTFTNNTQQVALEVLSYHNASSANEVEILTKDGPIDKDEDISR